MGKAISNDLVYSHGLPKGQMWYHDMLNVIIPAFDIRILFGHTVVPMCRIKGRQPSTRFPNLLLYEVSVKYVVETVHDQELS